MADIETQNDFMVGVSMDGCVVFLKPPIGAITADQAIRLAAWLVALCEHGASRTFTEVLEAVQNT